MLIVSRAYKDWIGVCLLFSIGSSIYTMTQAVNPFRGGVCRPGDNWPQRSTAIPKCLPASTMPTLRSKTMPSLSAKSTRQVPCQVRKIFWWGQLTPGVSQSVRGQENIKLTCAVTMREHYIKTSFPASELTMPLMEIDSRTIKYNHYNRLHTMYPSVYANYRRTLS